LLGKSIPASDTASNLSGFSKRDAEFYLPLKFRETYPNVALKGGVKLGERETYLLEAPAAGNPKRWYFDSQSGLLLRAETTNSSGKVLESMDYGDYRMVDGVQEPFNARLIDRDGTDFIIKLNEVRHNVLVDDASFDKPEKEARDAASTTSSKAKYEEDMSGISLTPETNQSTKIFKIIQVIANSPASDAGVQADDLITAIDGLPAANYTEARIERMFKQDGREFALTIKRGDQVIQIKLKLRRLVRSRAQQVIGALGGDHQSAYGN
jgi:PDZ domain